MLLTVVSAGFLTGCNREEGNPEGKAVVYIYDQDGRAIQNALVEFKSPIGAPNDLQVYKTTGIDGSAFVRWSYDVFIDVTASKGAFKSCTAIHLIPGETTEKDLELYPFNSQANGCP